MPIYAFQCTTCGHDFDKLQKMSDPDPELCPECGAKSVKRQLTAPSFRLAGSGWYETDFKKDGDKKRNLVDAKDGGAKSEAKGDGKASETKSDSKPSDIAKAPEKKAEPAKTESKPAAKPASGDS